MIAWIPDATALSTFRTNPEAFRLRHRLGLRPPKSSQNQADAGSALHVALDLWFRSEVSDLELALVGLRTAFGEEGLMEVARPLALMERVLKAYAAKWPREKDRFTVLRNESYIRATITTTSGAFDYCAIEDRKVAYPDGSVFVMDSKSTSAYLSNDWGRMMGQSDQLIGQVALERALGQRCDGFIVDGIHVSDRATVKWPAFLRHGPVLVPEWRVRRWADDVEWTLGQIAALEAARGVDRPWPVHHNWSFGKPDAYFQFLEQPPELHAALYNEYEREIWEPERAARERETTRLLAKLGR